MERNGQWEWQVHGEVELEEVEMERRSLIWFNGEEGIVLTDVKGDRMRGEILQEKNKREMDRDHIPQVEEDGHKAVNWVTKC